MLAGSACAIDSRICGNPSIDSLLLADVYVELLGERQAALGLGAQADGAGQVNGESRERKMSQAKQRPTALPSRLTDDARRLHAEFVDSLGDSAIWKKRSAG